NDFTLITTIDNLIINFPVASTCPGRIYVIKNVFDGAVGSQNIINPGDNDTNPAYINEAGLSETLLDKKKIFWFQSDGVNWQMISK
ncbi:MAG: hypothetical protein WBM53_08060, partial [Maribacter sp.]